MTQNEAKQASYHDTPLTKVCLGMSQNGMTNWILVNYPATSLYSVTADANYHATNVGRAEWMSLISSVGLQQNSNIKGFNLQCSLSGKSRSGRKSRIGLLGNNESSCDSCDSVLGFGIEMTASSSTKCKWSSGNIYIATKERKTFGYNFIQ